MWLTYEATHARVRAARQMARRAQTASVERRAQCAMTRVRIHELLRASCLRGASDLVSDPLTPLITSIIQERPTCLLCIAERVEAPQPAVVQSLAQTAETVWVIVDHVGECAGCESTHVPVYSLKRGTHGVSQD